MSSAAEGQVGKSILCHYEAYLDSEVPWLGRLPEHWQAKPLKQCVDERRPITYGIVQCGPDVPDGVPYIRPVDMDAERGVDGKALQKASTVIEAAYSRSRVKQDDLVVSIGPSFGKVMLIPLELEGANLTQGTARVAPAGDVVPRFLFWCLRSTPLHQAWGSNCSGATFRSLTLETLRECEIPIPTREEQRFIAAFLDRETGKIDALIAKKQRLIELLQEKRTALITHAVTKGLDPNAPTKPSGIDWLGDTPSHWDILPLGRRIQLQRGVDITKNEQLPGDVPVVSSGGVASFHSVALAKGPGVVVGRKGSAGTVHWVEVDYWPHDTTLWVREFRESLPRYVYYKLAAMDLASFDTGSANPTVNRNLVHPVVVSWPPRDEQAEIADALDRETLALDRLVAKIEDAIGACRELRTALITAAVTGKIDVRERGVG